MKKSSTTGAALFVLFLGVAGAFIPVIGWFTYLIFGFVAFILSIVALGKGEALGGVFALLACIASPFFAAAFGVFGLFSIAGKSDGHKETKNAPKQPEIHVASTPTSEPAPFPPDIVAEPTGPTTSISAEELAKRVQQSQSRAILRYPALGQQGTAFNKSFVELYKQTQSQTPALLNNPEWPEILADKVAESR